MAENHKHRIGTLLKKQQKLEAAIERNQHQHDVWKARLQLAENRERTQKQKQSRRERTKRLIVLGATLVHYFPVLQEIDETEARSQVTKIALAYQGEHEEDAQRLSAAEDQAKGQNSPFGEGRT